jgi:Family of unknown function (DUF6152)
MEMIMKFRNRISVALLVGAAMLTTTAVQAHHSIANFWDTNKEISVSGVVKTVKLVNPHSELTLDVMEDGKPVKWVAFGLGITDLRRRGITSEMLLGKTVTIEGHPPKQAAGKGIFMAVINLPDGSKINIRERGVN